MKAAVLTMHRVGNYGSVLQAAATRQVLQDLGLDVEFIDYWRPDQLNPERWAAEHSRFVRGPVTKRLQQLASREYFARFSDAFHGFVEEHLPLSRKYTSLQELRDDPPEADIYVAGSDQVWNTDYNIGGTEPYLLQFGPKDTPRISLASSIGKHPLSEVDAGLFRETLPAFAWCSVREESASSDLADLGITAEVLPDPTLLLPPAHWRSLGGDSLSPEPFVVLYTLNRGTGIRKAAKEVARDLGLPLITLNPRPLPWVRYHGEYRVPPVPDFLRLMATASHVVTDSFHATVFSLNLGTPITVSMPPKYATRLESVLHVTGTETRNLAHPRYTTRMSPELSSAAVDVFASKRDQALTRLNEVVRDVCDGR